MSKIKENKSKTLRNKTKISVNYKLNRSDSNYYCNECDYSTECLGRMNAHMICHSNRRPFVCDYANCDQSFKRQQSLKRHIKTLHLKERLYCCHICQKRFTQSQSLNDHLFVHLDNKSFKCPFIGCNKVFQTPKYLKSHQSRRHSDLKTGLDSGLNGQPMDQTLDLMTNNSNEILIKALSEPMNEQKTSLTINTNIDNILYIYKCEANNCGQAFRLKRSLNSHYKFSHSDNYDKNTKSLNLVNNYSNDFKPNPIVEQMHTNYDSSCSDSSIVDNNILTNSDINRVIDKISNNTYIFECNFSKCNYRTKSFDKIADHFDNHWRTKCTL